MPWNAIDALDDARWAAQSFLLPVDRGRWLRLAIIALFVAGGSTGGSGGSGGGNVDVPAEPGPGGPPPFGVDEATILLVVGGVLLAAVLLGILWAFVGAVMEFVLVDGLRTREVEIRGPFREFLGKGVRLFAFRVGVVLLLAAVVAVPIVGLAVAGSVAPVGLLLVLPLLLAAVVLGFLVAVVFRLTTDFAVPTMLAEDRGVLSAWGRLWPLFRREWKEVGAYLVVRLVAGIAAAIAVGLVMTILAVVVAIPFLVLGALVFFGLGGSVPALGTVGFVLLGLLLSLFVLALVAIGAVVQVPVVTFFRYYALFFLGASDDRLDLVGHLRGLGDGDGEGEDGEGRNDDGDDRPGPDGVDGRAGGRGDRPRDDRSRDASDVQST
jgi:hypothetical protein